MACGLSQDLYKIIMLLVTSVPVYIGKKVNIILFLGDVIIIQKIFSKERSPRTTISVWEYSFPVFICA